MAHIIDIFLHLDQHLLEWIAYLGPWIYVLLFAIIFAETGLVVTPFLPGDSLLFAIGALTAIDGTNGLNLYLILGSLTIAAIIGDGVNYHIGKHFGPRVFERDSRFIKRQHLIETQEFYKRWGSFTIVAARFAPIVRTFAPFVAGVAQMNYRNFVVYNVAGAFVWVFTFVLAGYFFGNAPVVKNNFQYVIFGIIIVSALPIVYQIGRSQWAKYSASKKANQA